MRETGLTEAREAYACPSSRICALVRQRTSIGLNIVSHACLRAIARCTTSWCVPNACRGCGAVLAKTLFGSLPSYSKLKDAAPIAHAGDRRVVRCRKR